ncbi:MAG: ABC transporter substrate-binding protein, partial [Clostridia bacterium]
VLGSNLPGAIRFKDEKPKVVNQYDTDEYRAHIALRERWVKEGLTQPMEVVTDDIIKYVKPEGEIVPWLIITGTVKPGAEANMKDNYGLDMTCVGKTEPLLGSYGLMATLTAVNSDTRYPEKSVELIELLNTDKYLYNLLTYGLEGKNYTKVGENRIEKSTDNPYTQPAWAIGNTFNAYLLPGQADDLYEQTAAINKSAFPSPILGFVPDRSNIELEITNCLGFIEEYTAGIEMGIVDREQRYNEFLSKLKAAGVDKIIDELNTQLEEWQKDNR